MKNKTKRELLIVAVVLLVAGVFIYHTEQQHIQIISLFKKKTNVGLATGIVSNTRITRSFKRYWYDYEVNNQPYQGMVRGLERFKIGDTIPVLYLVDNPKSSIYAEDTQNREN